MTSGPSYSDGVIRYNFAQIHDVATALGTYEGAMDGALHDLYGQFKVLFAQDWQGQAGQACEAAQVQWSKGVEEIKTALRQVAVKLHASVDLMQQVDQHIAAGM